MAREDISARITSILEEHLEGSDLCIYRVTFRKEGPVWVLRVFLDKTIDADNEYVSIEDCEKVTSYLSDKLDDLDFIDKKYNLEVSSPGLDRELIRDTDYVRFAGRQVEVRTYEPVNGSRYIEGVLIGKSDDIVTVEVGDNRLEIPSGKISKINLAIVF